MRFPVYSRAGGYVGDIPSVLSAARTRNVDGTDQLEIACIGIDLQKDDRVLVRCRDAWREYAVASVSRSRADSTGAIAAVCRNSVCELSRKYTLEKEGRGYTATQALDKAIEGTRWARGTVDAPGTADVSFYHQSALESLEDICAAYGCELDATVEVEGNTVRRRLVHLRAHVGEQKARRRFEYSRDLVSIRRTVSAEDVVTRLYPWGKGVETENGGYSRKIGIADVNGGKPYIEDTEATRRFGIPDADGVPQPNEGSWEDGNIEEPSVLLSEARKRLKLMSAPRVSYEAEVAVMARAGEGIEGAACGDAVQIVDTAFEPPLRLEGRILETVEDLTGDLSRSRIKLGNVVESYTKRNRRVEAAVQKLTGSAGAWDDAAGLGESYLNGVIDGLNAVLNETGGYTYLKPGEGIFVYDRPEDRDPTQCIQIGGGYFRVANRRRPDGSWDFRTIGTGSGLVADSLYTGTIEGGANSWNLNTGDVMFRQGGIRDSANKNYWNLDTGEFSLQAGAKVGGKTVQQIADSAASSAASSAVANQTQRDIFNKLTNGGQTQGIYLTGGRIYINGEYIKAGTISTDRIESARNSSLYVHTGTTVRGNPGTSFVDGSGDYMSVEALRAVDDPTNRTTGTGLAIYDKGFLDCSTYYEQLWLNPPMNAGYLSKPAEQLYMRCSSSGDVTKAYVELQRNDNQGVFFGNGYTELRFDGAHYVRIDSGGVQCRCGSRGFGWLDGKFYSDLVWN